MCLRQFCLSAFYFLLIVLPCWNCSMTQAYMRFPVNGNGNVIGIGIDIDTWLPLWLVRDVFIIFPLRRKKDAWFTALFHTPFQMHNSSINQIFCHYLKICLPDYILVWFFRMISPMISILLKSLEGIFYWYPSTHFLLTFSRIRFDLLYGQIITGLQFGDDP